MNKVIKKVQAPVSLTLIVLHILVMYFVAFKKGDYSNMKILLTGFDPFGGEALNPAEEAVKRVASEINSAEIIKLIIPTVRYKSLEKKLKKLLKNIIQMWL